MEELREAAARTNMIIPAKDEKDYLGLVRAADIAVQHVAGLPPYIDPRLVPKTGGDLAKERAVIKPTAEENPLKAWSHKASAQSPSIVNRVIYSDYSQCNATLPGASGPLSGRSVAVKDNVSVAGVPITLGTFPEFLSADGKYPVSEIDASVVTRVLEAGGTLAGTATCENYSASPLSYTSATGRVENPWGAGHATGGSSSGCASLVAASMKKKLAKDVNGAAWDSGIDLAIGGDQGGSIRVVSGDCMFGIA